MNRVIFITRKFSGVAVQLTSFEIGKAVCILSTPGWEVIFRAYPIPLSCAVVGVEMGALSPAGDLPPLVNFRAMAPAPQSAPSSL